jgi:cobalt/nickel transport system permease protein
MSMTRTKSIVWDFTRLDRLSTEDTAIHRLDPRAKVLVTIAFIVSVISFNKYEVAALFPFFIYPAVMIAKSNLPTFFIVRKVAFVIPFALVIGLFNPFFDREIVFHIGATGISGGWISLMSIAVRAILTVSAAFILVGVTGFFPICGALERLAMPRLLAVQLFLLFRYIFVLWEEGTRVMRSRELRSWEKRGKSLTTYGSVVGHLLLRTWLRAERIHMAMRTRGFTGEFHTRHPYRFGTPEVLFLLGWSALFLLLRIHNVSLILGSFVMEVKA